MAKVNLLENYKKPFTLDGRLRPQPGVTAEKVKRAQAMYEKALSGDRIAEAQMSELLSSTDLAWSMSHLMNLQFIPQLPEEEKSIAGLVTTRTVRDFHPVTLFSLINSTKAEDGGLTADGAAPIVPEGARYPLVSVKSDEESFYSKLAKRGFRFDYTWESRVNDTVGFFEEIPGQLLNTTIDTQYAEIFDALDMASQHLPSVTLPDETVVPADAPISPEAIIAMDIAIGERLINGRKIGEISAYNVFVPTNRKKFLEYQIERYFAVIDEIDGALRLRARPTSLFPNITIIETDRLTGTQWKMVPKPGATKGRPVWEMLRLRGYELPELRVKSDQGFYPGGGKVDIWQGGFEADTLAFRYRYIVGSVLWDDAWVGVSDGDGTP